MPKKLHGLDILPDNWKEEEGTVPCNKKEATEHARLFPEALTIGGAVVVEDDCAPNAVVIVGKSQAFRLYGHIDYVVRREMFIRDRK